MTHLLDANVLIALATLEHVHHDAVEQWFAGLDDQHATCPITQSALIRFLVREGRPIGEAMAQLSAMQGHERHRFWADDIGFDAVRLGGVIGHRQVTDAYLAGLARHRSGRLATLDDGLATLHDDVAILVPR